ncbi:sensor histidine kinase [Azotosporobacter soli]|uniref:cache domain-containing sensor histidine kinase n=1 Tax=Azotosporobacter soli TaxID=3055040 RepID=UPI0031FEA691
MLAMLSGFFRNKAIGFKLQLYFFILTMLPIITLGILGNLIYSNAVEEQANIHTVQMTEQVMRNVELHIRDMENIASYINSDAQVLAFFKEEEKTPGSLEAYICADLSRYSRVHPEIAGILLVNAKGDYISNEMVRIARDPLVNESWYKKAMERPEQLHLFSKPIGRNIKTIRNYSANDVVSIAKAVLDPQDGKRLGVILIDLKLDMIKSVIESITLGKSGFLYIMDDQGGIVYAPVNPVVYRVKPEWLSGKEKSVEKTIQDNKYQIIYKASDYTKWKTVGVFSVNENLKEIINMRQYSILIALVTLVFSSVVAFFFTGSIAKPLGKLRVLMKKAEDGDLTVRFNSKYQDEVGALGNSFNHMIIKIGELIQLVYSEQKRKREAELKILQAQIKPHFLYNTLDTIHWMARERGANDIVAIVGALAKLFRIGLSKGKEIITVGEELEHIRSYLLIQKARYEDKLNYEIIYDEEVLACRVLKVILQPLVENAIYHGLNARRGGGTIVIKAEIKEDKLFFSVADDGMGMDEEKLAALNEIIAGEREPGSIGFGVYNVNERIRLTFGSEYGLRYHSVCGEGTTIEILHPLNVP